MKIASWTTHHGARAPEFKRFYGCHLPSIFKAISELRTAIGEKFTSADLDVLVFECDRTYEPSIMVDGNNDGRRSTNSSRKRGREAIIGTTGVGLIVERNAKNLKDDPQVQFLIPPKIVLQSTLDEALELSILVQSTRRSRKKKEVDGANQDGRD